MKEDMYMKIGFIGIGNMAKAIINGIEDKDSIIISSRSNVEQRAKELSVNYANNNIECAQQADIIFLCVKPEQFKEVLDEINEYITYKHVVSIAAKLTINDIKEMASTNKIIRVMPNLNVAIKEGTCAICKDNEVSETEFEVVKSIFENLGDLEEISETLFPAFIGIAGSAPAFIFSFMEGLIKEALLEGMNPEQALEIVRSTMRGSAEYLSQSKSSPQDLIEKVCSPGGTTIEGINSLNEDHFQTIIAKAVRKTINKDKGII